MLQYIGTIGGMKTFDHKFKIWNKRTKKWCGNAYPGISVGSALKSDFSNLSFVQYIGVRDEFGIDICEGDVVKRHAYCERHQVIDGFDLFEHKELTFVVDVTTTYTEILNYINRNKNVKFTVIDSIYNEHNIL